MHHRRPSLTLLLVCSAVLLLGASQLGAQAYEITLLNGNTFLAKGEPEEASYDPEKLVFQTADGNRISLRQDEIQLIELDADNLGFGSILDTQIVVIGITANDYVEPEPGELEGAYRFLAQQGQTGIPGLTGPIGFGGNPFAPQTYSAPQFAEPNTTGGGIPLSFVNSGIAPLVPAPVVPVRPPN